VLQPFLFTTMTEPLAAIVILWSVPWLVAALRFESFPYAMVAVAGATAALSIRMGAMLFVPFLVLWAAFSFRNRARSLVVTLALAGSGRDDHRYGVRSW
jgi:Gpi18-like mannosyltransferase